MAKKMLIDATHAEETRVVVVDGTKVEEFDFETVNKRQLSGNIYLAKVTRVEPSLQAAFVDYGGNRHGFLAFAEIHPDYYQIPAADRDALIAEERAYAEAQEAEDAVRARRRKPGPRAESVETDDETVTQEVGEDAAEDHAPEAPVAEDAEPAPNEDGEQPHADDAIESIAEEDVSEEIRVTRKPRPRRYKIQEVIKVRQIMLVQVVKEERGNKGAALTTYLSLAGRYCVLMPNTARGGGISRKITNIADRKKLKDIAGELDVPKGAGLIIRTAGSQRTRTEIRRDYEYLLRLWEQIRDLTFKSVAPAPIYEEGDLIKRTIRDLYSKEIDEVLVEGERGYRVAKDFMKMIMPSHAKNVKHYADQMPLFARYQVESYLGGMFNPVVQLKSGGYIVIGVTEALVAIDVNSGRATKEGSIEDTALKTNLEASDEVARQLRLRDLAGLIVIDFIDMEERKNNAAVEKRLKDKLKSDRARIQVGRISGFGLMEMSRQRLRPGMLESTTQPCQHCHGTGLIRSSDSLALSILRAIEEEGTRNRSREVLVKAPVAVVNFLINAKREHIAGIEARYGLSVRVEADPVLISPDYAIEKFKTASRVVPEPAPAVLSVDAELMAQIDDEDDIVEDEDEEEIVAEGEAAGDDENGDARSRRRRRRRRRKGGERNGEDEASAAAEGDDTEEAAQPAPEEEPTERRSRGRSRSRNRRGESRAADNDNAQPADALPEVKELADQPEDTRAEALPGVNAARLEIAPEDQDLLEFSETDQQMPLAEPDFAPVEFAEQPAEEFAESTSFEPAFVDTPFDAPAAEPEPVVEDFVESLPEPAYAVVEDDQIPTEEEVASDAPFPATVEDIAADDDELREPEMADADRPKRRGWWSVNT